MANLIYRNQANNVFITYNSAEENVKINDEHIKPKNTSSITILTSGIPEYHIRIKNNFEGDIEEVDAKAKIVEPLKESKSVKSEIFSLNEDVLLKSHDEKLYLGTVVNIQNGKYLVKFDDNTEKWSCERDLKKLNSSLNKSEHDDEPLCVVCKERSETDLVEVCHKCSRGYHRHCLKDSSANFSSPWCCDRCTVSEIISISDSEDNESDDVPHTTTLPYNIKSLKWDAQHRENKEQIYCYCGETGSWKAQMLQCCKCHQWFHEKCTSAFKGFLMHGDTFFVFCCKICNEGNEFLHRANFSWKTAVHLVLYELTTTRLQKFYSISKEVAPFVWEKWEDLNLPLAKFQTEEKLIKKIMQTVKQEDEFKSIGSGKNKGKSDFVCLRRKSPAVSMKMCIPQNMIVAEKALKKLGIKTFPLHDEKSSLNVKQENTSPKEKKFVKAVKTEKRGRKAKRLSSDEFKSSCINDDSSDETSSKSALDWIIPAPSNFRGRNNPFHSQYKPHAKNKSTEKGHRKGQQMEAFGKVPEIRIVRTFKRRLSAKDIAMGPNTETKRRKMMKLHKSSEVEIISEIIMPLPYPRNGDSTDYRTFNDSKLMRRQSKSRTSNESSRRSSVETKLEINLPEVVLNSPVKKKSINLFFGALNRIENGEKFSIHAKRLTLDGKEQYLLDWDTSSMNAPSQPPAAHQGSNQ